MRWCEWNSDERLYRSHGCHQPGCPGAQCPTQPPHQTGSRGAGSGCRACLQHCSTAASNCSSNCSAGARTSLQPLTAGGGGGARVASGRGQQTETRGPWLRSNCVRRETWLLKLQLKMSLFIDHCWWSLQSSQKNKKCFLVDIFYDRKSIVLTKSMKLLHCFLLHIKKIRWSAFFINMTFLRLYEKIVPIVMVLSWFILDCHKKNIAAGYFALSSIMSKKKLFHNN